ncbi:MAG TPA: 2,3-diaminopropionate biosynthesis protein SbnA [Pyrinomonadaceae bacterium]|jgi:cysteine synthase A|nr:2,3-diaminopropionate biosynthesis protein SbnA [Pyrinomonadaceae bacterium]
MAQMISTNHAYEGILSAIGNTPLVKLNRVLGEIPFKLYGKLEMLNPGGSIKDRTALSILQNGLDRGELKPGSVVVESTSGNMGIGLAQACLLLGLRFICVIDPKTTEQNTRILRAYGAELEPVLDPDPQTGEYLQARVNRVKYLLRTIEDSFWPNQYANVYNPEAHHHTMHEIVMALDGRLDYLFCATSTCGTLRGCAEYVLENNLSTKIMAVDAVGSVIFGSPRAKRLIPGHGAAVMPTLFQPNLAREAIHVTDTECVVGCRKLMRHEAILAGGSSGAVMMAIEKVQHRIERDAVCVAIFPDRGERYLDTIYSDEWVEEHFGNIAQLSETPVDDEQLATVVS